MAGNKNAKKQAVKAPAKKAPAAPAPAKKAPVAAAPAKKAEAPKKAPAAPVKKESATKKKTGPQRLNIPRSHGAQAPFPPLRTSTGLLYFVTKASLTREARIFIGSSALYSALAAGRPMENAREDEVMGFASADGALIYWFENHDAAWTVTFVR